MAEVNKESRLELAKKMDKRSSTLKKVGEKVGEAYTEIRRPKFKYEPEYGIPALKVAKEFYKPYVEDFKEGFSSTAVSPPSDKGQEEIDIPTQDTGEGTGGIVKVAATTPTAQTEYQNKIFGLFQQAMGGGERGYAAETDLTGEVKRIQKQFHTAQTEMRDLQEQQMIDDHAMEVARQKEATRIMGKYEASITKMEELGLENKGFWADASLPMKIAAGIGLAAASTLKNPMPYQALSALIDKEANMQQQMYNNSKEITTERGLLFARNVEEFGSQRAAENVTRAQLMDLANKKIDSYTQNLDNIAALDQMNYLKEKLGLDRATLIKDVIGEGITGIGGMGGTLDPNTPISQIPEKLKPRWVPGIGEVISKKAAGDLIELKGKMDGAQDLVDQLIVIADIPGDSLNPRLRGNATTIQKNLVGLLRLAVVGPGALNEKELELLNDMIANPTDIFSIDYLSKERLKLLKSILKKKVTLAARAAGAKMPSGGGNQRQIQLLGAKEF